MRSVRLSLSIIVVGFLVASTAFGQTPPYEYYKVNAPVPITDFGTVTSTLTVPDNFTVNDLQVMVNISHTKASDLRITLKDPGGAVYVLSEYNGGFDMMNGFPYADFRYTIFDNNPTTPLGAGIPGTAIDDPATNSPLFRGIYKPESTLPTTGNINGSWTLEVYDNLIGNEGTLVSWGLIVNRYTQYKDLRIGAALDLWGSDRYSPPFIDDFTPLPQYTVQGYRPLAGSVFGAYQVQNSKVTSATSFQFKYTPPTGGTTVFDPVEFTLGANVYYITGNVPISQKGTYVASLTTQQRSDLYQTRPDNNRTDNVIVTPGSLAFDNGSASKVTDITSFMGECNGATYTIYQPQMFTSVDIWQSDAVELEPAPTPGYATIRVYDNAFTLLHTFGPYDLPKQGNKWVSYPVTPTMLAAGSYTIAVCVENPPAVGSTGFGVDELGSPFAPGGAIQRYYGNGVQWYSLDNGSSWVEESDAAFGTKMIRPNFIVNNSDIGVICFEAPTGTLGNSFTPQVRFGSFSHNPQLPNLLTVGKVSVIDNATGQTVAYTEKRIFFGPSSYETVVTFDPITGLAAGTYTLRAEVWRADDENDINNVYERTYVKPVGPVVISYNSKISAQKREEIRALLTEQGYDVQMFDRSFANFNFQANNPVVWAGEITETEAAAIREFVKKGNFFAVAPTSDVRNGDFRTTVFAQLANTDEYNTMETSLLKRSNLVAPKVDYSAYEYLLAKPEIPNLSKTEGGDDVATRFSNYVASSMQRLNIAVDVNEHPEFKREKPYTASSDIDVQGVRLGNLSVAQIVTRAKVERQQTPVFADQNSFEISQNYPNPFNPTTTINYNLPVDANVSIRVYDMLGRGVATLVSTTQNAGVYTVVWDATTDAGAQVASGLYLYRMEANPIDGSAASVMTKKMILKK